jgi:cation channel sperm-associated protein 4
MVMQTILRSVPDMANIVVLLLLVNFIFCVIGIDMFSEQVPKFFGDIPTCMFTLFIAMTQDGWSVQIAPLR